METIGRGLVREERSDSELVVAARADDPAAYGELFERWFDRAWNVARTILRDDDLAADVAQDTMVRAWQQLDQLNDTDAFGGWLLRSARNRALNRLAREGRSRASGDDVVSGLRDRGGDDPVGAQRLPEPDAVSEIRDRQELVWAAATALGERDVSLLDLHLRHGLSPAEIADELGVEANAAHQQLFRLRGRLGDAIGSYLLWRNGRPLCQGLADAVSGRTAFDRTVAKAVTRHQASCDHCAEERSSLVDPAKLFAAVPLLLVPPQLKADAAAALEAAGVPTGGSSGGSDLETDPGGAGDGPVTGEGSGAGANGPGTVDGSGAGADGIRLDLSEVGRVPAPVAPAGPTVALAEQTAGHAGPSSAAPSLARSLAPSLAPSLARSLAPSLAMPRSRAIALAGAGAVVAVVALLGLATFVLGDDGGGGEVAAIASETSEPELAGAQGGNGDEAPAGPASFTPSSVEPTGSSAPATGTTRRTSTAADPTTPSSRSTTSAPTTGTSSSTTAETTASTTGTTEEETTSTSEDTTTVDEDTTSSVDDDTTSSVDDDTSSSVDPPPDPPEILRFTSRGARGTLLCQERNQRPFEAVWLTDNTDSVILGLPNSSPSGSPRGSYRFCGSTGDTITLTATGPGGTATATTTL